MPPDAISCDPPPPRPPAPAPLPGACLRFFEELLEHALISDASPLFGVLERHEAMFRSQSFVAHKLTLLRIANQLLKRLSKVGPARMLGVRRRFVF